MANCTPYTRRIGSTNASRSTLEAPSLLDVFFTYKNSPRSSIRLSQDGRSRHELRRSRRRRSPILTQFRLWITRKNPLRIRFGRNCQSPQYSNQGGHQGKTYDRQDPRRRRRRRRIRILANGYLISHISTLWLSKIRFLAYQTRFLEGEKMRTTTVKKRRSLSLLSMPQSE